MNMSYYRFRSTFGDLQDCWDNMDDSDMSKKEERARKDLIKLCKKIAEDYGEEV